MATGAIAIERIAKATGTPAVTVDNVSRVLKQHQPPMWALAGQGGGKRAKHVEPDHLVNMALGLAWADPISNAPAIVSRLRSMNFRSRSYDQPYIMPAGEKAYISTDVPVNRLTTLKKGALGSTLDAYVYGMATDPGFREMCRAEDFRVQLSEWPMENAAILWATENGGLWRENYDGLGLLGNLAPLAAPAALRRTVTLPFALFEVLADLCADTLNRAQKGPTLPLSEPATSSAGPEMENAGPLPEGPALIRNQDRNSSDPAPSEGQPEANGRERQSQVPSRGPGRSHPRHRRPRDERAADSPDATAA